MFSNLEPTVNLNSVSASNTSQSVSANAGGNGSSSNTVFSEQLKKLAKELGITPEEYQALMNDPDLNFASKTTEEQLKFIQERKTADKPAETLKSGEQVSQSSTSAQSANSLETTGTAASSETYAAADGTSSTSVSAKAPASVQETSEQNVNNTKPSEKTEPNTVYKDDNTIKPEDFKEQNGLDFDTASYVKLKPGQMFDLYVEEYAKNKFLYSDSENPKSVEDWNNLSEKEQKNLINEARAQAKKELRLSRNITYKNGVNVTDKEKLTLEMKMSLLQAANNQCRSIESVKNLSTVEQGALIAETLDMKNKAFPERLSVVEKKVLEEAKFNLEAVKSSLAKQDGMKEIAENLCYDNVSKYILSKENPKGVNLAKAQKDYLETKQKNGEELTEFETRRLEALNRISAEDMENFGSRIGTDSILTSEIKENISLGKRYATAGTLEKAQLKANYAYRKYKDQPEKLQELMADAIACGELEEAIALHGLCKRNEKMQLSVASSDNNDIQNINAHNVDNLGEQAGLVAAGNLKLEQTNPERAQRYHQATLYSCTDEQMPLISASTAGSSIQSVQIATVDRSHEIKDEKTQAEVIDNIDAKSSEETKTYAALNAAKMLENNQLNALKLVRDSKSGTEAIAKDGTFAKLSVKNQTKGYELTNKFIENNFDGKEKIDILNNAADHISEADKSNQLDMHKQALDLGYSEVQEHVSKNIWKYDESVQSGALDATNATGNKQAIDAAMANYDKYSQDVQSNPKFQSMQKETEVRKIQEVAQQVADFHVQYEKLTGMKASINLDAKNNPEQETKLAYMKAFLNATPQEQFKMLSKVPASWQGTVYSKMATYCPQMLSSLVKQGYGKSILNTPGLSSDVIYKVINEMLTSGSSDKKAAVKFVKSHKSMFNDSTLERVEKISDSSSTQKSKSYASQQMFSMVKSALKPKHSDIYPNIDELDVYNG